MTEKIETAEVEINFSKDEELDNMVHLSTEIEKLMKNFGYGCIEREIKPISIKLNLKQKERKRGFSTVPITD